MPPPASPVCLARRCPPAAPRGSNVRPRGSYRCGSSGGGCSVLFTERARVMASLLNGTCTSASIWPWCLARPRNCGAPGQSSDAFLQPGPVIEGACQRTAHTKHIRPAAARLRIYRLGGNALCSPGSRDVMSVFVAGAPNLLTFAFTRLGPLGWGGVLDGIGCA